MKDGADLSLPSSTEMKNMCVELYLHSLIHPHSTVINYRDRFILQYTEKIFNNCTKAQTFLTNSL
jgi:hypothetical protein